MGNDTALRDIVKARYGAAARQAAGGLPTTCCDGGSCGETNQITSDLYTLAETSELPSAAVLASLGCGNPTALAELRAGETVLDLGSGGGIDVLLSARRVGPTGFAYGLDMTDDMLELANQNKASAGATNVEFLKGHIEAIPLPDATVDVIISNCVINLSADKATVFREAFRVLRPGGRLAVSDVVARGTVPEEVRRDMALWTGCIAGALEEAEFRRLLGEAGFVSVEIEPTRVYEGGEAQGFMSAFVRATKPAS